MDLFLMRDIQGRITADWRVRIVVAHLALFSAHGLAVHPRGPLPETRGVDSVLFVSGRQGIPFALHNPAVLPSPVPGPFRQCVRSMFNTDKHHETWLPVMPTGQREMSEMLALFFACSCL